jgi:hypothetical protein
MGESVGVASCDLIGSKSAVMVKFGVGKTKGVGLFAPGMLQDSKKTDRKKVYINIKTQFCFIFRTSSS